MPMAVPKPLRYTYNRDSDHSMAQLNPHLYPEPWESTYVNDQGIFALSSYSNRPTGDITPRLTARGGGAPP